MTEEELQAAARRISEIFTRRELDAACTSITRDLSMEHECDDPDALKSAGTVLCTALTILEAGK